jgi:hypothetical protein
MRLTSPRFLPVFSSESFNCASTRFLRHQLDSSLLVTILSRQGAGVRDSIR